MSRLASRFPCRCRVWQAGSHAANGERIKPGHDGSDAAGEAFSLTSTAARTWGSHCPAVLIWMLFGSDGGFTLG
jgi:hypothetical protein